MITYIQIILYLCITALVHFSGVTPTALASLRIFTSSTTCHNELDYTKKLFNIRGN